MARITRLKVENFKRIEAVELNPSGNVTIIGGMNEQGKSSLLDAISVLLQGKLAKIPQPVRTGAKKATIYGEIHADEWDAFGDLHITRNISPAGNWTIKVESGDGKTTHRSPETMLKTIFGEPVDPVAFVRMDPKARLEFVKKLVGLDFSELDAKRKQIYDDRTLVGREVKNLEGELAGIETYPDAPKQPVNVTELMEELKRRQRVNQDISERKKKLKDVKSESEQMESEIAILKARVIDIVDKLKLRCDLIDDLQGALDDIEPANESEITVQISESEAVNTNIRSNQLHTVKSETLDTKRALYDKLTTGIDAIDAEKADSLALAEFPVPGLSFDDSQVLYRGLPFDEKQLSSEELLRVSFSMAIAAQPALKNILIREGALLDANNLKLIGEIADNAGIGVFIETVGDDPGKATLIIENGRVKGCAVLQADIDEFEDI